MSNSAVNCPNCGARAEASYCPACGQRQGVVHASIGHIIRDALEDQLSLNGALPRTLAALLFKPGTLTREYMALRIAHYVAPLRLYLVTSVLFFLIVSIFSPLERREFMENAAGDSLIVTVLDSVRTGQAAQAEKAAQPEGEPGRLLGVQMGSFGPGWADSLRIDLGNERLTQAVRARLVDLGHLPPRQAMRVLGREFLNQIPTVMFIVLPVYALLLKILYIRRRRLYVEHFIFALHVHALTFAVFLLALAFRNVPMVPGLLLAWLPLYTLIALKRVYQQGWIRTGIKWFFLGNAYSIVLAFGALLGFVLAVAAV